MVDRESGDPSLAGAAGDSELAALKAERAELLAQLEYETDPDTRADIDVRLMQNRLQLERVVGSYAVDHRAPVASYSVSTGEHAAIVHGQGGRAMAPPAARPLRWRSVANGALAMLCIIGVAALAFRLAASDDDPADVSAASSDGTDLTGEISAVLAAMGLGDVQVEKLGDTIVLTGMAPSDEERASAIGAVQALAGDDQVDASNFTVAVAESPVTEVTAAEPSPRSDALQDELDRTLAGTPLIFESSATELTELHIRILNTVVGSLTAYADQVVTIVGYSDSVGDPEANRQVSLARAESVRAYLVSQGVAEASLLVEARGEEDSSGADELGGLERRVEFEVVGSTAVPADGSGLRVAIVAPSARNDLAFTQSMVDAVNLIANERGDVEVAITDNTFVPDDAAAAIRGYADEGYDLVIAHGSQFGASVLEIAPDYPNIAFAWGTASDTFGLNNVYAYDAASEEGGYVLGSMAALLSNSDVLGVVGPIEVGDAERYVNGFRAGALAEAAGADVRVTYTGSFSDLTLASETAQAHVDAGADVMTGSAQMVVGAVNVAAERNVPWFGTQANQTPLAPNVVVASQVYHWEVILRTIISDIETGQPSGTSYSATLANGGLVIEYNPAFNVPAEVQQRAEQVAGDIASGAISPG